MTADDEPGVPAATAPAGAAPPTKRRNGFYVRGWVLAVIGVVVALGAAITIGIAVRDGRDGDRRDFGQFRDHQGGGHRPLAFILLLILIALAVTAVVLIVRRYTSRADNGKNSAERVLAERFARGDIDEADYLSRRAALRS